MGLNKVVNLYYQRGFKITMFLADNEFDCLREYLQGKQINFNMCGPNEHVPEIVRMIRTVKERVRGILTILPFKIFPSVIMVQSVIFQVCASRRYSF